MWIWGLTSGQRWQLICDAWFWACGLPVVVFSFRFAATRPPGGQYFGCCFVIAFGWVLLLAECGLVY